MTTTSIAPTVVTTLKTLLTAQLLTAGLDSKPITVYDGWPADLSSWDMVIVGDQSEGSHTIPTMKAGRKKREEEYLQEVIFFAVRPGESAADARSKVYDHLDKLEDILANDPAIGLSATEPTLRLHIAQFKCDTYQEMSSQGWCAELNAKVLVQVRLV